MDQLLSLATVVPDQSQNCSERQLNYILLLNSLLDLISPLHDVFEGSQQTFFVELRATLEDPAFKQLDNLIRTVIHKDAQPCKGQYAINQRCFAIKPGVNQLLDVIRKLYSKRVDEMRG